jgi:hypothetical protein
LLLTASLGKRNWKHHSILQGKQIKINAHPNTGHTTLRPANWTSIIIVFKSLKFAFLRVILLRKVGDYFFDLTRCRNQIISEIV